MFWATFHIMSMSYPDEPTYVEKRAAKEFFNAQGHLLPCPVCREHFREILQGVPVDNWLDNRKSLVEWVIMVHNEVNKRLGKPVVSEDDFYRAYRQMAERGLPIPPSAPIAEIHDGTLREAYLRGATQALGAAAAIGTVGWLLWVSYRK
jgi:hypothetical protein